MRSRLLSLVAGGLLLLLAGVGLARWSIQLAPGAPPPEDPAGIGGFFKPANQDRQRLSPRKTDCGGCGQKRTEPPSDRKSPPIMSHDDALFVITGRNSGWTAPHSPTGGMDLALDDALAGRFIYWCGTPVGKVEGRWTWADGRLTVTQVDADHAVTIVPSLATDPRLPRTGRCTAAHAWLGSILARLPRHLATGESHGGYRVTAGGGGRAVLVATTSPEWRFDDCQVCVDRTGRPMQFDLTRARTDTTTLDAEHLICFVTPATTTGDAHAQP
jgi:hypothetical protein